MGCYCVVGVIVVDLALLCFGESDALITLLQIWQRTSPAGARQTRHDHCLDFYCILPLFNSKYTPHFTEVLGLYT